MQTLKTRFVGRITDSATAKNAAMQVAMEISDETIDIAISEDENWTWQVADVKMTRIAIDRFELELADETLYFLPVDPHEFARDAFAQFAGAPDEPFKGWLRRRIEEAQGGDIKVDLTEVELEAEAA